MLERLRLLRAAWLEVVASEKVHREAMRLLRVHSLNPVDALQLAAARAGAGSTSGALVTFDERLALAARLEGFTVLPERV